MSREELLAEALKLPGGERAELADSLLSSLEADPEWEAAWVEESKRRAAEWRAGGADPIGWREAMRQVREGLPGKKP